MWFNMKTYDNISMFFHRIIKIFFATLEKRGMEHIPVHTEGIDAVQCNTIKIELEPSVA